ncbi:porin [Roseixanthobacter liquoris]|uniref:porin n=1 Tax=Roseixanthobacter liquoris TaxID=3119921 RepID=UPI00372BA25C
MGLPFARFPSVRRTGALRRRLALAVLVGTFGAGAALAGDAAKPGANPCAQFGAGFQPAPGTDTCIKVGGAVRMDAGSGTAVGNAPNPGTSTTTSGNPGPAYDPWKTVK